jgi:vacuolar-type H+-ATPase catalytic subunit A/Vma1
MFFNRRYFLSIKIKNAYNKYFYFTKLYWLLKSSSTFTEIFFYFKRSKNKKEKITKKTQLLIDGPTRSGNHFAVHYVKKFNELSLARHYHSPGAIRLAFKKKVPTLLLIRKPIDQISSAFIYLEKKVPLKRIIKSYQVFYRKCLVAKDWYVVGSFDEIIKYPELVVGKINEKYDLRLKTVALTSSINQAILDDIKTSNKNEKQFSMIKMNLEMKMAAPNKDRDPSKEIIKKQLLNDYSKELKVCNELYFKVKDQC